MVKKSKGKKKAVPYDIGKRLKEIRGERGLTIAKVSAKTGVSASYLSLLEDNKRRVNVEVLEKLGACYNVKLHEFFQRPRRRPPKLLEAHLKGLSKAKRRPVIRTLQKVFDNNTEVLALLKKLDRK